MEQGGRGGYGEERGWYGSYPRDGGVNLKRWQAQGRGLELWSRGEGSSRRAVVA